MASVFGHLEMQVRARRAARRANRCNSLARLHGLSGADEKALRVRVTCPPPVGMFDDDRVPVATLATGEDHPSGRCRSNRSAARHCDINSQMITMPPAERIAPSPEWGTDATPDGHL